MPTLYSNDAFKAAVLKTDPNKQLYV